MRQVSAGVASTRRAAAVTTYCSVRRRHSESLYVQFLPLLVSPFHALKFYLQPNNPKQRRLAGRPAGGGGASGAGSAAAAGTRPAPARQQRSCKSVRCSPHSPPTRPGILARRRGKRGVSVAKKMAVENAARGLSGVIEHQERTLSFPAQFSFFAAKNSAM